jgi:hypothetical protein
MSSLTDLYLESLTPKEKQAYLIAKDHLKSLFDLENTNGFLQWLQKYNATTQKETK